jgi:hypothetical protein
MEKHEPTPREQMIESSVTIRDFLQTLIADDLLKNEPWSEEKLKIAKRLSQYVTPALPPSIKTLKFPNGTELILGDENDKDRVANWDIADLKKKLKDLESGSKFK